MWVVVLAASALVAAGCKSAPDDGKKGAATGPHASVLRLFPSAAGEVSDWKAEGEARVFGPIQNAAEGIEDLQQDLGPAAATFQGYGYIKSAIQTYGRGQGGEKVVVRVFEMKTQAEAFGVYSVSATGSQFPDNLGLAARMNANKLAFAAGPYFVTVEYRGTNDPTNVLMEFGRWIAQQIGSAGNKPTLLQRFPTGAKEGEMYYLHTFQTLAMLPFFPTKGNTADIARKLDLSMDTDVAIVGYPTARPGFLNYLFVIQYPSETQARTANNNYNLGYLHASTNPAEKLIAMNDSAIQAYLAGTLNAMENSDNDRLAELLKTLAPPVSPRP
jgi:hypothetical protein